MTPQSAIGGRRPPIHRPPGPGAARGALQGFSGDGIVNSMLADYQGEWRAAVPLADGRVLAVGSGFFNFASRFAPITGLASIYKADGTLDTSFYTDGQRELPFGGNAFVSQLQIGLAVQPDGKVLVAANQGGGGGEVGVFRLNADGTWTSTAMGSTARPWTG